MLKAGSNGAVTVGVVGSHPMRGGVHTWQIEVTSSADDIVQVGICEDGATLTSPELEPLFGTDGSSVALDSCRGLLMGSQAPAYLPFSSSDVVSMTLDFGNMAVTFSVGYRKHIVPLSLEQVAKTWLPCASISRNGSRVRVVARSGDVGPSRSVVSASETGKATLAAIATLWHGAVQDAVADALSACLDMNRYRTSAGMEICMLPCSYSWQWHLHPCCACSPTAVADRLLGLHRRLEAAAADELFPDRPTFVEAIDNSYRAAFCKLGAELRVQVGEMLSVLLNQLLDASVESFFGIACHTTTGRSSLRFRKQ